MINPLAHLRSRRNAKRAERLAARSLYFAALEQARSPELYSRGGVPDSLDGRFDMVVLHVWLVLRRLRHSPETMRLQRRLQETSVADFDSSLRELGVGDLGVGRRVRAMARAQAGRFQAYDAAVSEADNAAIASALARNVWRGAPPDAEKPQALACYLRRQHIYLSSQDLAAIARGEVAFEAF